MDGHYALINADDEFPGRLHSSIVTEYNAAEYVWELTSLGIKPPPDEAIF